jgi:CubicO group peptidase (beta-lactamase class C family)
MLIKFFAKRKLILLALVCCTGFICGSDNHQKIPAAHNDLKQSDKKPGTYWELTTPEEQGIDSQILLEMLQKVKKEKYNSHSIIIVRNHRLVLESYICPYTRDIPHNTRSASKSMVSALVGIALREKWINSLDRTVYSYLPQYFPHQPDPRKKKITLQHLLTMAPGLKIQNQSGQTEGGSILSSPNPVKMTFEFPMSENPGERFNYLTSLINVMSLILTETSGKTLKELADTYLFAPLGIKDVQWKKDRMGNYFTDAALTGTYTKFQLKGKRKKGK